jgi:UDP-N-acetylglucosamine diphosphorylase / glucose-1-phosphate thymidylyltransferase / UDP-N-acetylgalactosamine diphosphorylase / glucosamine-1-phosphate N-acetyltransferase / galactosamine-1-phosphate N-acetyltransferase
MKEMPTHFELFDLVHYSHKKLFDNITNTWDVLDKLTDYFNHFTLGSIQGTVSSRAYLINPDQISIGIGSIVEPGAYIKGPCIIGNYCTVRHGAYIRGGVITGDHCVIGHSTEVKNSIFLNYSQAAHFSYVGDSVIGNHVNLGAGVKLANLLFSKKNIKIQLPDKVVDTKRRKLGAILGDHSQIGCNSVTNPGTILCKSSHVHPNINVGGIVSEEYIIKSNTEIIAYPQKNYAFS